MKNFVFSLSTRVSTEILSTYKVFKIILSIKIKIK